MSSDHDDEIKALQQQQEIFQKAFDNASEIRDKMISFAAAEKITKTIDQIKTWGDVEEVVRLLQAEREISASVISMTISLATGLMSNYPGVNKLLESIIGLRVKMRDREIDENDRDEQEFDVGEP